ncbi:unnamed protein product [Nezara viridula]|uniref:Thioredoxin domain-containing protein n=1 Tax=Nezara viridula TaxID=85310 RepID=A0A9P0MNN1_NEZVI|nr:unnamed protein product [Nezara viridula]
MIFLILNTLINTRCNFKFVPSTLPFLPWASVEMVLIEIADGEQFGRIVYQSCNRLLCVYFCATWALPCELIDPIVNRFAVLFPQVHFLRVTVHVTPQLVPEHVRNVPTFHFFYNMTQVGDFEGDNPEKLEDYLNRLTRDPTTPIESTVDPYAFCVPIRQVPTRRRRRISSRARRLPPLPEHNEETEE